MIEFSLLALARMFLGMVEILAFRLLDLKLIGLQFGLSADFSDIYLHALHLDFHLLDLQIGLIIGLLSGILDLGLLDLALRLDFLGRRLGIGGVFLGLLFGLVAEFLDGAFEVTAHPESPHRKAQHFGCQGREFRDLLSYLAGSLNELRHALDKGDALFLFLLGVSCYR